MKMMDAELGKLDAVGDTPHVRRLMKDSYPLRLRSISSASESARPSDILARFPHLKNVELALTPLGNDLSSNQNEGARLVVYIADNTIAVAFIIADDTKFKIESPSVEKCMLALTAYYHGLDRTYPTAYKSFFSLFDEFIFKLKVSVPISYKCFKKDYLV
ncbi:uncharacterized protein LOC113212237 isoform X1 [Frankliniella occidentalis]|uniref:Uncharacterized protein LOC113212237 isoform X1 n=1 Tax=Frankliniella occidentalis TaxID=133901 RepID=A0A9C6XUI8_FRAOC|nr:uncharacterized protein LOC113212237 isoform X1 [Frankliniella occidentalis]